MRDFLTFSEGAQLYVHQNIIVLSLAEFAQNGKQLFCFSWSSKNLTRDSGVYQPKTVSNTHQHLSTVSICQMYQKIDW